MMIVAMNRLGDGIGRQAAGVSAAGAPVIGLVTVWVNQCLSRGTVHLQSADPLQDHFIDENMLDHPSDVMRMRDGVRRTLALLSTDAFRAIGRHRLGGLVMDELDSDAALDRWILANAGDTQHGTSSCRMGDARHSTTVVDPDCHVLGCDGLRVIDASIMPAVVRANTHLTTVMLAERMAERLRGRTEG